MLNRINLKQKTNILLIIIIFIGGVLRFVGTVPGYNPYHADENMSYSSAWSMVLNGNFDPTRYDYPSLVPLINNILFHTLFIPVYWAKYFILHLDVLFLFNYTDLFPTAIVGPGDINPLFWSRLITAFFSTVLIYLAYLLSYKIFNSKLTGILTAAIIAVNYRVVMNSHFGLPDIYNAFFYCLALIFIYKLLEKPSYKNYLLAGFTVALSFNVKFQIFTFIPFLLAHFYIVLKTTKPKKILPLLESLASGKFIISSLLVPLLAVLLNPYLFENFDKFVDSNQYTYLKYLSARSSVYGISYLYHIALTPIIFLSVFAGALFSIFTKSLKSIIPLSLAAIFLYTILWGVGGAAYTRNFVSIIPILLIFSGRLFFLLYQLLTLRKKVLGHIVFLLIFSLALYPSFINSVTLALEYTTSWEMRKMNNAIYQYFNNTNQSSNTKTSPIIASHPWDFSIVLSKTHDIKDNFTNINLEPQSVYSLQELQQEGADYALIGLDVVNVQNSRWITKMNGLGFNFWQNKNQIIKNQFVPLAINELTQNTIFAGIKKWQAPDNNYIFVKIPASSHNILKQIKQYNFDNQDETKDWLYTKVDSNSSLVKWDGAEGYLKKGAITFTPIKNSYNIYKIISPIIQIEEGKSYQVEGFVKSKENIEKNQREGFFRIDYYSTFPNNSNEKTIGDSVHISARYFGQGWVSLKAEGIAPPKSHFATISFQISSLPAPQFWLDDIKFSENTLAKETKKQETIQYTIPDTVMFPFSQGGL